MPDYFIDRATDLPELGSGKGDVRRSIGTELVDAGQAWEHHSMAGREMGKVGSSLPQILDKCVLGGGGLLEWVLDRVPPT
jgi:hypothetical protein